MTQQERTEAMEQAIELVIQAQELTDAAVKGTDFENQYYGYGRFGFDRLLGNGNPYDLGLPDICNAKGGDHE